ncbi:MLO-like protein 4 [Turnera subulata]|uniref:MLO-like protein n=1 Tax=Turnera subulata TaxID=218843 RepID=A0A9Q0J980_9ROSI|nr:MLO-like protein 4 [Turnera subulata]
MEEVLLRQGRSLAETPTYSVASVVTFLVFACYIFQRSIYRFGKWLKKTRRKALFASLEKIKEELMLLGLISLFLAQCARWISEICVNSSLFSSKFYLCSEKDYDEIQKVLFEETSSSFLNSTHIPPKGITTTALHQCGEGREPFVSLEGLEQLHRFLFVLGVTHVLYSCMAVALAMSKIYSWRKWENQASIAADDSLGAKPSKVMRRQTTFVFHHTSHPWSRSRVLIWMLCFLRQFKSSIKKSDYLALRLGFITKHRLPLSYNFHKYMVRSMEDEFQGILGISWPLWAYSIICIFINIHGLNIYFWLSFIPVILVMLVGTKLQHVVSTLALEIREQTGPSVGNQVKPRDDLFWFGKPDILLRLIQFIIFQNSFEMATFIWSLWGFKQRSCFMKNHWMIIIRLTSGVLVQFWCSYSTVPLNVIITQMGSRCKKALVAESVRESLHSWCKRVKERSKRDSTLSVATRSVCSLDTMTIDERDEITVASGTLSRSSSLGSLNEITVAPPEQTEEDVEAPTQHHQDELSLRIEEYLNNSTSHPPATDEEDNSGNIGDQEPKLDTLLDLFQRSRD